MKYYTVLIVNFNDGTPDKMGIYLQPSEDAAIKAFFNYMGQYTNNDNVESVFSEATNSLGGVYKHESWSKTYAEQ